MSVSLILSALLDEESLINRLNRNYPTNNVTDFIGKYPYTVNVERMR